MEACLKCSNPGFCNDVTIREGVCTPDYPGRPHENLLLPFRELDVNDLTKRNKLRFVNIESNLRNMYFQNAFRQHRATGDFEFEFAQRYENASVR